MREVLFFECDHMRSVVLTDEGWCHILLSGRVGGLCSAGAYRQIATSDDEHTLDKFAGAGGQ